MELRAGVRLDRYTLVLPLGEGGQAVVWKVIDPLEGGAVRALKVFHLAGRHPQVAERARREAKASAGARHPGLLPCRTLIEDPAEEILALVFDYVRGRSLADALSDPRMTAEHRRCAVRQIADTLAYVHEQGVIHRDVKPDNVLVSDAFWDAPSEPGTLKLVDFGIAAPAGNPKPLTREGVIVGTAPYLPPELLDTQGVFGEGTDFQRDVFALGVLAWEVLVGKHPTGLALDASRDAFAGVYLGARAGKRAWPPEPGLSTELRVAAACLALWPKDRPDSAMAISRALRADETGAARARTNAAGDQRVSRPVTIEHATPTVGFVEATERTERAPRISAEPRAPSSGASRPVGVPIPQAPARGAKKSSVEKWLPVLLTGLMLLGAAAALAGYLLTRQPPPEPSLPVSPTPSRSPSPNPTPSRSPSPNPTPSRSPSSTPTPSPTPRPAPPRESLDICCEKGKNTCPSGRSCTSSTSCTSTHVNEQRSFFLRVSGGFLLMGGQKYEIPIQWPNSEICLKNSSTGKESCASSKTILSKLSDRSNRILATPEDLQTGKVTVRVVNGNMTLAHEYGYAYPYGYSTTDLCGAPSLRLHDYDHFTGKIFFYLDDP